MASTQNVGNLLVKLLGDDSQYQKMLKKVSASTMRWGKQLTMAVTGPILAGRGLAVKAFADFDQAMVESTSIMSASEEQTKRMEQTALNLSKTSTKGPAELAKSYYFLASAGLDAEKSMAALPTVIDFATAGAFDMAQATDLLTDAQTALGIEVDDAGANMRGLGDHIVLAARQANASVQQFSESITADAGVAARNFGMEIETTMAVLGAYASAGKKGAEGGNLMGRATRLLTKASRENGEAFKKYGIDVVDKSTGKYRNFIEIIGDMEKAFEDMPEPIRDAALEELGFAALAQKSITPLLGMTDVMKEFEAGQRKAADTMEEVKEKQMKSFANQWKLLKNEVTVAMIEIGKILAPTLMKLRELLSKAIKEWSKLSPEVKKNAVAVTGVVAAIGPALISFSLMVTAVKSVGTSVLFMTKAFQAAKTMLTSLTVTTQIATVTMGGLKKAITAVKIGLATMLGPISLTIAAVTAIIAVVIEMTVGWDGALEAIKNWAKVGLGFIQNFSTNVKILWDWLKENWLKLLKALVVAWAKTQLFLWKSVAAAFRIILRIVITAWGAWLKIQAKAIQFMFKMIAKIPGFIAKVFMSVLKIIWSVLSKIPAMVGTVFKAAWGVIKALPGLVFKAVGAIISGIVKMFKAWVNFQVTIFKKLFTGDLVKWAWEGLKSVLTFFADMAKKGWDILKSIFTGEWVDLGKFGDDFKTGFEEGTNPAGLMDQVKKIIEEETAGLENPLNGVFDDLDMPEFETEFAGMANEVGDLAGENLAKGTGDPTNYGEVFNGVKGFLGDVWDEANKMAIDGVKTGTDKAGEMADATKKKLQEVFVGPNAAVTKGSQEYYDLLSKVQPATTPATATPVQSAEATNQKQLTVTEHISRGISELVKLTQKMVTKPQVEVQEAGLTS